MIRGVTQGAFKITALGTINAHYPGSPEHRLSPASRHLLAVLIAAGPSGISASDLAWERDPAAPPSEQAVRMAAARLRKHLTDNVFPRADDGTYRLTAPVADVDVWTLNDLASRTDADIDLRVHQQLLVREPAFTDVPSSDLLDHIDRRIRSQQKTVLCRIAEIQPDAIAGEMLEAALRHVADNPVDEHLAEHSARALARSGDRAGALKLIGQTRLAVLDAGLELNLPIERLEQSLLAGVPDQRAAPGRLKAAATQNPLRTQLSGSFVGDQEQLDGVVGVLDARPEGLATILIAGPSGSGKTRLCAEAAQHATDAGWPVVSIVPSTLSDQTPFAPMVAALPSLAKPVSTVALSNIDADSARIELWAHADRALQERRSGGALMIVADDTQWLDDASAEFLAHFVTSRQEGPTVLLLNGRGDVSQSARWEQLRDRVETIGATTIEIRPLTAGGIRDLVDDLRPRLSGSLLNALSQEIFERSAGLPGVARLLLASVPEGSAVLTGLDTRRSAPLAPALASLSETARQVGIAAAVVGPNFGFDALRAVSSLDDSTIFSGLDELVDRGLVVDVSLTDFELAHALAERGLLSTASRQETADAHRLAAIHYELDVHRRSHHLARALPTVETADAIEALCTSADRAMSERSYRLAVRQFETAQSLNGRDLHPEELGQFSRALDLCGMHQAAQSNRRVGFDAAAARNDWSSALAIATSGLPEVETLDGDPALTQQLQQIDVTALSNEDAWKHACHAARQNTITGSADIALAHARNAVALATDAEQRVGAALAHRFCLSANGTPANGLAAMRAARDDVVDVADALQADYWFNLAVEHHRSGNLEAARAGLRRLDALAGRSAVKQWHCKMMEATLEFDAGNLQHGRLLRSEAHSFAVNAGLGEADNAMLASTFVDMWLSGTSPILVDEVDGGVLDPSHRHLTQAAAAAVLFESGQLERAGHLAVDAVATARGIVAPQTIASLGVVAAPLARFADAPMLDWVRQTLEAAGDSMLILGASAANLGPVARYRAQLSTDEADCITWLHRALHLAEQSDSPLWQAVVLRDLVEAGETHRLRDLGELLEGTEVGTIVAPPTTTPG